MKFEDFELINDDTDYCGFKGDTDDVCNATANYYNEYEGVWSCLMHLPSEDREL